MVHYVLESCRWSSTKRRSCKGWNLGWWPRKLCLQFWSLGGTADTYGYGVCRIVLPENLQWRFWNLHRSINVVDDEWWWWWWWWCCLLMVLMHSWTQVQRTTMIVAKDGTVRFLDALNYMHAPISFGFDDQWLVANGFHRSQTQWKFHQKVFLKYHLFS